LKLPDGRIVMLVDTVGFVSRLPHTLVEAFKSTLEETKYADLILNVCDASNEGVEDQINITKEILNELGVSNKAIIDVYNKCDIATESFLLPETQNTVKISALKAEGIEGLLEKICQSLPQTQRRVQLLLPFSLASTAASIRRDSRVITEEYRDGGIFVDAVVDAAALDRVKEYVI